MTKDDEKCCFENKSLILTTFRAITQKCEAVDRALQISNPETTFSRYFPARIHLQVLRQNLGLADSIVHSCKEARSQCTKGSSVIMHIISDEKQNQTRKQLYYLKQAKLTCLKARQRKYNLNDKIHLCNGISDPKPGSLNA